MCARARVLVLLALGRARESRAMTRALLCAADALGVQLVAHLVEVRVCALEARLERARLGRRRALLARLTPRLVELAEERAVAVVRRLEVEIRLRKLALERLVLLDHTREPREEQVALLRVLVRLLL